MPDQTDVVHWRVLMLCQPSAEHFHFIAETVLSNATKSRTPYPDV
jgi:hypothetical protein